eukprot:6860607-Prymnesium_polylepis.1
MRERDDRRRGGDIEHAVRPSRARRRPLSAVSAAARPALVHPLGPVELGRARQRRQRRQRPGRPGRPRPCPQQQRGRQ